MYWKTAIGLSFGACVFLSVPSGADEQPGAKVDGEKVYQTYCYQCHGTGFAGAPLAREKQDWERRIAAGMETMLKNARQGLNAMPPMGTCTACSDAELQAAIAQMLQFD